MNDMTTAEIHELLTTHRCYPWPRRDPDDSRVTLATIRCGSCGELVASRDPLAPGHLERAHQAAMLYAALSSVPI